MLTGIGSVTEIQPPALLPGGVYRWRVASCQAGSSVSTCVTPAWSSDWSFTMAAGGTALSFNPPAYDFGGLNPGETQTQNIIVDNTSGSRVIGTFSISGSGAFSCVPNCDYDIDSGRTQFLSIKFTAPNDPPGTTYNAILSSTDGNTTVTAKIAGGGGGGVTTAPTSMVFQFRNPIGATSFTDLTNTLINFLFTLAVILAPILLVIAGVIFMTAAGEPGRVKTARSMLLWTVVGFGIILIAKGLVEVLKAILGI